MRFTVVTAAIVMMSVFGGVARGQASAQPKLLENADVVKMVQAGLDEGTIVLAIQSKPGSFDTSPEELIRLKQQGVTAAVLNAMLNVAQPAPAAPAPSEPASPQPGQQTQVDPHVDQGPMGVWIGFYGTCQNGDLVVFKPTIYANKVELARLACNTYFYVAALPGTYKFCATRSKCTTTEIGATGPYYFRILPTTFSYSIGQMDVSPAQDEMRDNGLVALDLGRVLARKMVTINTDNPPAVFLMPSAGR